MELKQEHNFYRHHCGVLEQSTFYASCLKRVACEKPDANQLALYEPCFAAIKGRRCPALGMRQDEENGLKVYYRDRDDCGPGILKRDELGYEPRTQAEIAYHHGISEKLGQPPAPRVIAQPQTKRAAEKPAPVAVPIAKPDDFDPFDLGGMITTEARAMESSHA